MKQYENDGPAPKISVNKPDKKEQNLEKRVRELTDRVSAQQEVIDRMHRDIVRLRVVINEVAARIK